VVAVLSEVLTSTENPPSTALSKVKVIVADPVFSFTATSAMVTVALSSLVMVPVPVASLMTTSVPVGFDKVMVIVSSNSTTVSPLNVTSMVCEVSPTEKETVPLAVV